MKQIVLIDEYNETDIKPRDFVQEYIQLTKEDLNRYFGSGSNLKESSCPGCLSHEVTPSFQKFGMVYVECMNCHSLFISPRPGDAEINLFYQKSKAGRFWRDELPKLTRDKRAEKIIKPRFQWILDSTEELNSEALHFVDVNTHQYGYVNRLETDKRFRRKTLLDPFLDLQALSSDIEVIRTDSKEIPFDETVDVISLFEVLDHSSDVDLLLNRVSGMLKTNGLCFVTAILASGFDLQILWDQADNILPPDRLNVFSLEGLRICFDRHRLECLEISTPGIFDLNNIEKAVQQDSHLSISRFVRYFLENRDHTTVQAFQNFLQDNLLSSYGRFVLRKI